jgi:hypothetical protein
MLEMTRGVLGMTRGLPDKKGHSRDGREGNARATRILTSEKFSVVVRTLGTIN